jgi:hypothetical protein
MIFPAKNPFSLRACLITLEDTQISFGAKKVVVSLKRVTDKIAIPYHFDMHHKNSKWRTPKEADIFILRTAPLVLGSKSGNNLVP